MTYRGHELKKGPFGGHLVGGDSCPPTAFQAVPTDGIHSEMEHWLLLPSELAIQWVGPKRQPFLGRVAPKSPPQHRGEVWNMSHGRAVTFLGLVSRETTWKLTGLGVASKRHPNESLPSYHRRNLSTFQWQRRVPYQLWGGSAPKFRLMNLRSQCPLPRERALDQPLQIQPWGESPYL